MRRLEIGDRLLAQLGAGRDGPRTDVQRRPREARLRQQVESSDERAAASERQRGDAQALAAEAVAERDEACRRANVEQGSREAMEEQMRIFDKERNKLWEQLSLSRAEMAASNEGWDRLWLILGIR